MRALIAIALVGCGGSDASESTTALAETTRHFDGFALGDHFAKLMAHPPYDTPCDADPMEHGNYRAVVYGARTCHHNRFPADTSVVFILEHAGHAKQDFDEPIRAFGWMGGSYYADKIKLPIKIGDPVDRGIAVFGTPRASFDLRTLHVDWFEGAVSVLSEHNTVVGFVFGEMPRTGGGERWDAFDQMYRKHTPRLIPPGAPSVDDCKQLLDKRQTLGMPKPEADVVEREIERCRIGMSKLQLTCALAAPTLEEMTKCDR